MSLWQDQLTVIDPHVAIKVEEAHRLSVRSDPLLGQGRAKLGSASCRCQPCQFAPQRFDFRRSV